MSETQNNTLSRDCSDVADHRDTTTTPPKSQNWALLLVYCATAAVGAIGGPFLQRLYYMHGGSLKWLSSCVSSVGFLILLPPLSFFYFKHLSKPKPAGFFMDTKLFLSSAVIGIIVGLNNYMYSTGLSYIPVSTSSLLYSTQLAFIAFFSFIIVKQKFTFYTLNAVLVITFAAFVLALHTSSDRPAGVTKEKYLFGFFFTLGGAALWGVMSPLIEMAYSKSTKPITCIILLQVQCVMNVVSTLFSIIGMAINKDFQSIPKEAREFGLGEDKYYLILVSSAILYQLSTLGTVGIISCRSSLFVGIFSSGLLPIIELAAVITFHDKFTGEKGLSLGLSLWGFTSYFLGEFRASKAKSKDEITDEDGDRKPDIEGTNQEVEMSRTGVSSKLQEV